MEILVVRSIFKPDRTLGKMYIDGVFFAYTLEDTVRILNSAKDKIKAKTAIPYGRYKVTCTESFRFKRVLPLLHDVPYFEAIRIHGGNAPENSEGCILIGANTDDHRIWNCPGRVNVLVKEIERACKNQDVYITLQAT